MSSSRYRQQFQPQDAPALSQWTRVRELGDRLMPVSAKIADFGDPKRRAQQMHHAVAEMHARIRKLTSPE
jgi:hypothetical protein